jgi:uncharacterized protein
MEEVISAVAPAPVARQDRISAVDAIRGFSLLGILLVNIVLFGQAHWAYNNPHVIGGSNPVNIAVWAAVWILAEGKMRAIFSMLFGAGVILLTSRAEQRGPAANGPGIADIYARRNLWLLLFGILHCYLFWIGDILYSYALTALIFLYPMRRLSARMLLILGALVLLVNAPRTWSQAQATLEARDNAKAAAAAGKAGKKLTKEQESAKKLWQMMQGPTPKAIEDENNQMRGGYLSGLKLRMKWAPSAQSLNYYKGGFCDVLGMMLLGMGLLKLGFLSAQRTYAEYAVVAVAGYLVGLPINIHTVYIDIRDNFDPATRMLYGPTYDVERFAVAFAHIAVVMMLCKSGRMQGLTSRLAGVGQMALTNYLFDTVACCIIFYGWGFGLFGRLERYQLYYVVAAIWAIEFFGSRIWLAHYRFGPAEWLWRSLTYWKRQPMYIEAPAVEAPIAIAVEA